MAPDGIALLPWNWLGHAAGAAIFGMFAWLVWRDRSGVALAGRNKAISAAVLALLWNAGELASASVPEAAWLAAAGAACLSVLPAVLFDLAVQGRPAWASVGGYGLGAAAALLHLLELAGPSPRVHALGLYVIAAGFAALAAYAALGQRRLKPALAVLLFALTFLHFGSEQQHLSSPAEALVHHAGIPLAMFVLLRNYRYVFLDALTRFLANLLLAFVFGLAAMGVISLASQRIATPAVWGATVTATAGLLLLFAAARGWVQSALTTLLFGRTPAAELLARLRELSVGEADFLNRSGECIAGYFSAGFVPCEPPEALRRLSGQLGPRPVLTAAVPALSSLREHHGVEAVLPVASAPGRVEYLMFSRRAEGRRYLSEDLSVLALAGDVIRESLDRVRALEMERLVARAELRSLQAQIHPHFLFNALNTLYSLIPRTADGARRMVLNLSDLFRYFLRGERSFVTLREEMQIVAAYLEIESMRLGERLESRIFVDGGLENVLIPLLSVEPLVENAVKHGVAPLEGRGTVEVTAKRESKFVRISVFDTGRGFSGGGQPGHAGIGLSNVRKRLALCYGTESRLEIQDTAEGTTVSFRVPLDETESAGAALKEASA